MPDESSPVAPAPMEGRGVYNRSSRVQAAGLAPAVPLLEQTARTVPLPDERTLLTIADYGASQGRNSLAPMRAAIRVLRERIGPGRAITVVHTDLPSNDFGTLFLTLEQDPDSYLRDDAAVFACAVGRSFYKQLLPPASVTLGWCSWAVQWLSRAPALLTDHVQAAYSRNAAARAAFAQQAAEDWRTFLLCRARELRPGGKLVVLTMALRDSGDFGYAGVVESTYGALLDLVEEQVVRSEELRRMVIPTVGRSRADLAAPFSASGHFGGLVLERLDLFDGEDRIWAQYLEDRDASAYGQRWAAFSRASVFPSLALGLAGGSGDPRAPAFVEKLEARMAGRLAAKPEKMTMPLASVLLSRE